MADTVVVLNLSNQTSGPAHSLARLRKNRFVRAEKNLRNIAETRKLKKAEKRDLATYASNSIERIDLIHTAPKGTYSVQLTEGQALWELEHRVAGDVFKRSYFETCYGYHRHGGTRHRDLDKIDPKHEAVAKTYAKAETKAAKMEAAGKEEKSKYGKIIYPYKKGKLTILNRYAATGGKQKTIVAKGRNGKKIAGTVLYSGVLI